MSEPVAEWRRDYQRTCFEFINHAHATVAGGGDAMPALRSFAETVLSAYPEISRSAAARWGIIAKWTGTTRELQKFMAQVPTT